MGERERGRQSGGERERLDELARHAASTSQKVLLRPNKYYYGCRIEYLVRTSTANIKNGSAMA